MVWIKNLWYLLFSLCLFDCSSRDQIIFLDSIENTFIDSVQIQDSNEKTIGPSAIFRSKYKAYNFFRFSTDGYYVFCLDKKSILKKDTIYLSKRIQNNNIPLTYEWTFEYMKLNERIERFKFLRIQNIKKFDSCLNQLCENSDSKKIIITAKIDITGEILDFVIVRGSAMQKDRTIILSKLEECKINLGEILPIGTARYTPGIEQYTFVMCND